MNTDNKYAINIVFESGVMNTSIDGDYLEAMKTATSIVDREVRKHGRRLIKVSVTEQGMIIEEQK